MGHKSIQHTGALYRAGALFRRSLPLLLGFNGVRTDGPKTFTVEEPKTDRHSNLGVITGPTAALGRVIVEMARVLKPGGRLIVGELGRWSFWAVHRRIRGWFGDPTWHVALFRTALELRQLMDAADLNVMQTRGAIHYPRCGFAAQLFAPFDLWLGRKTTIGSAFIAVSAGKTRSGR